MEKQLTKRNIPSVLNTPDGGTVKSAFEWESAMRPHWRDEILSEEYGRIKDAEKISVSVTAENKNICDFAGKGCMQNVNFTFTRGEISHTVECQIAYPVSAESEPCPFFVYVDFSSGLPTKHCPAEEIIDGGFGLFHVCHNDITSDDGDFENGLARLFVNGERDGDAPGKIMIWSYFLQRMMDYLLTRKEVNSSAIGVSGHSRLGKTALLTAALDERFAFCCPNNSGCSGVALSRGKPECAETVARICERFPYWFCPNYLKYCGNEQDLPFDQHHVVSLIAPRFVCVGVAELDFWADNEGQRLALLAASPIWELYGKRGFSDITGESEAERRGADGSLCFYERRGTHFHSREDWQIYMSAVKRYLVDKR